MWSLVQVIVKVQEQETTGNSSGARRFYTDYQGGGGSHSHSAGTLAGDNHSHTYTSDLELNVQYVDLIIAAKD
jgi:hypothetical protein